METPLIGQAYALEHGSRHLRDIGVLKSDEVAEELAKAMMSSPDEELPGSMTTLTTPSAMKSIGEILGMTHASVGILWAALRALYGLNANEDQAMEVGSDLMSALVLVITSHFNGIVHVTNRDWTIDDDGNPGISVGALCCLYPFIVAGELCSFIVR